MSNGTVKFGTRLVGSGQPCLIIGEIGINHNGDLDLCRQLITMAAEAGCEAVKFQKRDVDVVYSPEELARERQSPFGTTNGDLKRGLEFERGEYEAIATWCDELGLAWTASCWDEGSLAFIESFEVPFYKIASASLTDDALLRAHRQTGRPIVLSTGMSSLAEIDHAVEVLGPDDLVLLHCTSTYPTAIDEINLGVLPSLARRYGVPVGYSGHEQDLLASTMAVALGACIVERHITLDRAMWGSDQSASLEPSELHALVAGVRQVERTLGDGTKRVFDSELPIRDKLRRIG